MQTCRGSHTHTLVTDAERQGEPVRLRLRHRRGPVGRGARGLLGLGSQGGSEHRALQHRRHPGAARRAAEREASSTGRASSPTRRPAAIAGLWQGGDHGQGTQTSRLTNQCHDITVFPEIGLAAGACSGNGILLDISRSGESGPPRSGRRQELRLLAFGDVQQRRHEGGLHRRMGRRRPAALPRDRSADLGRRRDLRHRRSQAALRGLLQDAGAADRAGELRRAQRLAHPGARARHHGAGVVSGRRLGVRLHRLGASRSRSRSSIAVRSTPRRCITGGYWSAYWYNGHIYGSEIARGIDVFRLKPSEYLSQNEIDAATLVRSEELNTQQQTRITWPASSVVARAYVDQLTRTKGIQPERARGVKSRARPRRRPPDRQGARRRRRPRSARRAGDAARKRCRRGERAATPLRLRVARRHDQGALGRLRQ